MSVPATSVSLELNQIEAGEFVVGSSLVGGSDVIGDGLSDIKASTVRCSIRRGRWGALYEDFEAGVISVTVNNEDRLFDPVYSSGTYFGELVPGRDVRIESNGITIATGFVEDYDMEYDVSGRSVTLLRATDAIGRMGALQFDQWTNYATTSPTKLDAICDRPEVAWASSLRDFIGAQLSIGTIAAPVTLAGDTVSWGSNVLNYMRLIARSDFLAFLFASADGRLVLRPVFTFATLDNSWVPGMLLDDDGAPLLDDDGDFLTASVASFGGSDIPYQTIRAQYGSETLFSEVSADTDFIDAQTATVADVSAWQLAYGPSRRLSLPGLLLTGYTTPPPLSLLVSTEDFVMSFADDLLAYYDTPTYRITELSVELAALSEADQNTVLAIDIADPVDVSFTPNGVGAAIEQTLVVQGIAHEITPDSHVVTFALLDYLAA